MQGGIHAGEIDGKDAGFLALREMLDGTAATGALAAATFVFVPVFNVDGHERFGRWNRPNQGGPEEMGWRTTAQNLNLNRDYVKADAPEMQAMLRLLDAWDPILYVDLHVTDGAKFQHDVSYNVEPTLAGDAELQRGGRALRDELMQRMRARARCRSISIPRSSATTIPPRASRSGRAAALLAGYWAARNRIGVLVETHSWKDYPTRVRITRNTIVAMMEMAARDGRKWLASREGSGRACSARRRHERRADVREHAARAHDRFPRLRVHARAVGGLRRAADALRQEEAADLARAARGRSAPGSDGHGAARRIHRAGRACAVGRRQAGVAWHRVPHAASATARADAEVFRASKVTPAPATFEGSHARRARRPLEARAARHPRGLAVRADRAGEAR